MTVNIQATPSASRPAVSTSFSGTCFVTPTTSTPSVLRSTYAVATASAPLTPGSVVHVEFDSALGNETQVPQLSAYINADLDGDGKRLSVGEYNPQGANTSPGFPVTIDPSKPTALGGKFSRFFTFTYTQVGTSTGAVASPGVFFYFNDPRTSGDTSLEWVTGASLGPTNPAQGFPIPVLQ